MKLCPECLLNLPHSPHAQSHDCCARAEGSSLYTEQRVTVGFGGGAVSSILAADPERWPILVRARHDIRMAQNPKIEWLVDERRPPERCNLGHLHAERTIRKADFNYTMIFRQPVSNAEQARAPYGQNVQRTKLEAMFDDIEWHFQRGQRRFDGDRSFPFCYMGGVRELLGRWPHRQDDLRLYILRDLEWISHYDQDGGEWLCEVSLMAVKLDER